MKKSTTETRSSKRRSQGVIPPGDRGTAISFILLCGSVVKESFE